MHEENLLRLSSFTFEGTFFFVYMSVRSPKFCISGGFSLLLSGKFNICWEAVVCLEERWTSFMWCKASPTLKTSEVLFERSLPPIRRTSRHPPLALIWGQATAQHVSILGPPRCVGVLTFRPWRHLSYLGLQWPPHCNLPGSGTMNVQQCSLQGNYRKQNYKGRDGTIPFLLILKNSADWPDSVSSCVEFHSFPEKSIHVSFPLWTPTNTSLRWEFSYQLRFPFHCLCDKFFNLFALSSSLGIAITLTTLKRKQNSVLLPSPIYINILIWEGKVIKMSNMHKHVISSTMKIPLDASLATFRHLFSEELFPLWFLI